MKSSFITSRLALIAVTVMMIGSLSGIANASTHPEPNVVPTSWELDLTFQAPRTIAVRLPGDDEATLFWYMTYTVLNKTDGDQLYIPDIWLLSDAGDLVEGNRKIQPIVFEKIKAFVNNPLLLSPIKVAGRILQGDDHARDGVVIWKAPDHDVSDIIVFFGGITGETHEVKDPLTGESRLLRKALQIDYDTPGDHRHVQRKPFVFKGAKWVVR
jgi:hypothetical protein